MPHDFSKTQVAVGRASRPLLGDIGAFHLDSEAEADGWCARKHQACRCPPKPSSGLLKRRGCGMSGRHFEHTAVLLPSTSYIKGQMEERGGRSWSLPQYNQISSEIAIAMAPLKKRFV